MHLGPFISKARWLLAALVLTLGMPLAVPAFAQSAQPIYYATEELNVRNGPGMDYRVIGELDEGEAVTILRLSGKWARIAYQSCKEGYVFLAYLAPTDGLDGLLYATADLNLRAGPGTRYAVVGELTEGDSVKKVEESGSWTLVLHQGKKAYAFAKYLSPKAPLEGPVDPAKMQFATLDNPHALYQDAKKPTPSITCSIMAHGSASLF